MPLNIAKVSAIVSAQRDDARQTDVFSLDEAIVADAAISVAVAQTCYAAGNEARLSGVCTRAAAAVLTAGTAIVLGTLSASLRAGAVGPTIPGGNGTARDAAGVLLSVGTFTVAPITGVLSFTPHTSAASTANIAFVLTNVPVLVAGSLSDVVA